MHEATSSQDAIEFQVNRVWPFERELEAKPAVADPQRVVNAVLGRVRPVCALDQYSTS